MTDLRHLQEAFQAYVRVRDPAMLRYLNNNQSRKDLKKKLQNGQKS